MRIKWIIRELFFHNQDSYKSRKKKWNLYYFQILIQLKINIQFNYGWIFYCSGHCLFIGFLFTYLKRWRFVCLDITMENSIIVEFLDHFDIINIIFEFSRWKETWFYLDITSFITMINFIIDVCIYYAQ